MIYSDQAYKIHKLMFSPIHEVVAEIYKEERLIAVLFEEVRNESA